MTENAAVELTRKRQELRRCWIVGLLPRHAVDPLHVELRDRAFQLGRLNGRIDCERLDRVGAGHALARERRQNLKLAAQSGRCLEPDVPLFQGNGNALFERDGPGGSVGIESNALAAYFPVVAILGAITSTGRSFPNPWANRRTPWTGSPGAP